jgi:hypothetical protein
MKAVREKPKGKVREWQLWILLVLSFASFVGIAYEVCRAITWALSKVNVF